MPNIECINFKDRPIYDQVRDKLPHGAPPLVSLGRALFAASAGVCTGLESHATTASAPERSAWVVVCWAVVSCFAEAESIDLMLLPTCRTGCGDRVRRHALHGVRPSCPSSNCIYKGANQRSSVLRFA